VWVNRSVPAEVAVARVLVAKMMERVENERLGLLAFAESRDWVRGSRTSGRPETRSGKKEEERVKTSWDDAANNDDEEKVEGVVEEDSTRMPRGDHRDFDREDDRGMGGGSSTSSSASSLSSSRLARSSRSRADVLSQAQRQRRERLSRQQEGSHDEEEVEGDDIDDVRKSPLSSLSDTDLAGVELDDARGDESEQ
jgi:hypothetical protein